jgi:hypothetical protein
MPNRLTSNNAELAGHRYLELDSLRGVAAMIVVLYHASRVFTSGTPWQHRFYYVFPGSAAVVLFFVLSGFVLTNPLLKNSRYVPYISKRFCRLYLPFAVGLTVSALVGTLIDRNEFINGWVNLTWQHPLRLRTWLYSMSGVGNFDPTLYNTSYWTLVVEMRLAIVFPAIVLLVKKMKPLTGFAVSLSLSLLYAAITISPRLSLVVRNHAGCTRVSERISACVPLQGHQCVLEVSRQGVAAAGNSCRPLRDLNPAAGAVAALRLRLYLRRLDHRPVSDGSYRRRRQLPAPATPAPSPLAAIPGEQVVQHLPCTRYCDLLRGAPLVASSHEDRHSPGNSGRDPDRRGVP